SRIGAAEPDVLPLFQQARGAGRAVGFVTTARVTHSSVAPFYARAEDMRAENDIAEQLVAFAPDVAIGGGARYFLPRGEGDGRRTDERNLLAEAEAAGIEVRHGGAAMDSAVAEGAAAEGAAAEGAAADGAVAPRLVLLGETHLPHALDRQGDPSVPALGELVDEALQRLQATGKPWFLVVEAARLDHAARDHDAAALTAGVVEMTDALRRVLEDPDAARVLTVLVSDHDTASPAMLANARPDSLAVVRSSIEVMEWRIFRGRRWRGTPRDLLAEASPVLDAGALQTGLYADDLDRLLQAEDVYERRTALGNAISRRFGIAFLDYSAQISMEVTPGVTRELVPVRAWGPRAAEAEVLRDHAALGAWLRDVMDLPPGRSGPAEPPSVDTPGEDR
ncbi:MAG: hypothetical protein HKN12_11910, partial [Gemmatimonadetes bacterium]|nr:hypothetical protein [Gemmatimonadota bacterium]